MRILNISAMCTALIFAGCGQDRAAPERSPRVGNNRMRPRREAPPKVVSRIGHPNRGSSLAPEKARQSAILLSTSRKTKQAFAREKLGEILHASLPSSGGPDLSQELKCGLVEPGPAASGFQVSTSSVSDGNEDSSNVIPVEAEGPIPGFEDGDFVIKYSANCGFHKGSHQEPNVLVRNYQVMQLVDQIEAHLAIHSGEDRFAITPSAVHLSGPSLMTAQGSSRGLYPENVAQCVDAELRYLVMQRGGVSLSQYMHLTRAEVSLREALVVGKSLLELVFALHEYGLVHGDLSWKNVLLTETDGADDNTLPALATAEFVLIDWDQARLVQLAANEAEEVGGGGSGEDLLVRGKQGESALKYRSPIALAEKVKGAASSSTPVPRASPLVPFYEDLYRVYELMGALMGGKDFYAHVEGTGAPEVLAWKQKRQWLLVSGASSQLKTQAEKFHKIVMDGLEGRVRDKLPADTDTVAALDEMLRLLGPAA